MKYASTNLTSFFMMSLVLSAVMGCIETREDKYLRLSTEMMEECRKKVEAIEKFSAAWQEYAKANGYSLATGAESFDIERFAKHRDAFEVSTGPEKRTWDKWKAKEKQIDERILEIKTAIDAMAKT